MASTFTLKSSSYQGRYMELSCTQVSNGSTANSSTIKWTLKTVGGSADFYTTGATKVTINGTQVYSKARVSWSSGTFPASIGSVSGEIVVPHNNEGDKSIDVSFSTAIYTSTISTYSGTWVLDKIPRYANITTFKVDKRNETSVKVTWGADRSCDKIWYSTNNGSSWVETSGYPSFYIEGLTANTSYNFKIKVRATDSQLTSISNKVDQTTYDYPHCTSSPNFTVGEKLRLSFYNPLGRSIKIYLTLADGLDYGGDVINSSWIEGYASEGWKDRFYSSIPNATSGKYQVKVVHGDIVKTRNNGNTYNLNLADCTPTFTDFTYRDSNTLVTDVTENDQVLVKGLSRVEVSINSANKMVANKSATPKNYVISMDTLSTTANYSDSDVVADVGTIVSSGLKRLNVRAYDSRNNSTLAYKDITVYDYTKPVVNVSVARLNNFEAQTTLKINGTFTGIVVDNVDKNAIQSVQYRYREVKGEWSDWIVINTTVVGNKYTCNDVILSLDNTKAFEIEAKTTDRLDSNVASGSINVGEAIFFISTNKKECFITGNKVVTGKDINRTDLDSYTKDIVLGYGHNLENTPTTNLNLGHVISIPRHDSEGFVTQLFSPYTTDDLYIRSCNEGTWGEWRAIQEKGKTLYENSSGSNGTITLNETSANFGCLEIFYCDNNNCENKSVRLVKPNGKDCDVSCFEPAEGSNVIRIRAGWFNISGTSIIPKSYKYGLLTHAQSVYIEHSNYIKIVKVVGYR